MSTTAKVLLGLLVVTVFASIPIITNVSKKMDVIPNSTPLEVPSALKKIQDADQTFASKSSEPNLLPPNRSNRLPAN